MPPEQRRAAIIEATIPLLQEQGTGLTTKQVAEAAGVAEGTIFRVFDSLQDLIEAMLAVDIWCGEVKTHLEAEADPQVRHLGAITHYDHPTAGRVKVVGPAVKLSETPAAIDRPALSGTPSAPIGPSGPSPMRRKNT
mgnify:CR=1 FL=1